MRDYKRFDEYYSELIEDVYPQPMDEGHLKEMKAIINQWIVPLGVKSVLDVGCGEGDAQEFLRPVVNSYTGIAIGNDVKVADEHHRNVIEADYNFLNGINDGLFDLVFSRHSLEHSPFPLITLMEWHRISNRWLCLVLPNPEHYTFVGKNHYSVMGITQAAWILRRAGWKMQKVAVHPTEYWFLCTKAPRVGPEGWKSVPPGRGIYDFERDLKDLHGEISNVPQYMKNKGK